MRGTTDYNVSIVSPYEGTLGYCGLVVAMLPPPPLVHVNGLEYSGKEGVLPMVTW